MDGPLRSYPCQTMNLGDFQPEFFIEFQALVMDFTLPWRLWISFSTSAKEHQTKFKGRGSYIKLKMSLSN